MLRRLLPPLPLLLTACISTVPHSPGCLDVGDYPYPPSADEPDAAGTAEVADAAQDASMPQIGDSSPAR